MKAQFIWRVIKGDPEGMCLFRMGSNPNDLKIIKPKNVGDSDGRFPCGRQPGFENKEFRLPSKACSDCYVQLEWTVPSLNSKKYYCADIEVLEPNPMPEVFKFGAITELNSCPGVC